MDFYSGKGVVRGRRGRQLGFALLQAVALNTGSLERRRPVEHIKSTLKKNARLLGFKMATEGTSTTAICRRRRHSVCLSGTRRGRVRAVYHAPRLAIHSRQCRLHPHLRHRTARPRATFPCVGVSKFCFVLDLLKYRNYIRSHRILSAPALRQRVLCRAYCWDAPRCSTALQYEHVGCRTATLSPVCAAHAAEAPCAALARTK